MKPRVGSQLLLAAAGVAPLSGCALVHKVFPEPSVHVIDFPSSAMELTLRRGQCASDSRVLRGTSLILFRCSKTMMVRHSPIDGRNATILVNGVGNSVASVAGTIDGDTVRISVAQPDNDHPVRATGICRLHVGPPEADDPLIFGYNPLANADRIECTADRAADGKRVLHFVFVVAPKPPATLSPAPAPSPTPDPQSRR